MADVPTFVSSDLVRQIGVIRPDSFEFGGGLARGLQELSAGAGRVAQVTGDIAEQQGIAQSSEAGTKAAAALQRDADGNLGPLPLAPDNSPENLAFNHALKAGALAGFENDQRLAAATYRAQAPFDPQGFAKIWEGHTQGTLAALDPRFQPLASLKLAQIGTETQNGILEETRTRDFHLAANDWKAQLDQQEADLQSLASAGQIGHPAYMQTANDYVQTLKSGVASGFIGQGAADVRRAQVADIGEAFGISSRALGAFKAAGGGPAGEAAAQKVLDQINDPKLQISPEQRLHIQSIARRQMIEQEAIRRQTVDSLQQQAEPLIQKIKLGVNVDPGQVESIRQGLIKAGEPKAAAEIETYGTYQQQMTAIGNLPIGQQRQQLRALHAKMADGTASVPEAMIARALPASIDAKAKALTADPFGYGVQAHPDLVGTVAPVDFTQDPATVATQMAMRATQAQKISAYEGVFVPPLSTPELKTIRAGIIADPANAPGRLATLRQESGPAWQSVWKGLVQFGGLPPEFQAVGKIDDQHQADLLARGLAQGVVTDKDGLAKDNPKVLTDLLPEGEAHGIGSDIALNPDVQKYLMSLGRSGASGRYQDAILGSIKMLAWSNAVYGGADRSTAVKNAVHAFTGNFEYMPGNLARVPSDKFDAVAANAGLTLDGLKPDALALPSKLGKPGQPSVDDYMRLLKSAPTWITAPSGDALLLIDNGNRIVRQKNGQPVTVPFDAPMPLQFMQFPSGMIPSG